MDTIANRCKIIKKIRNNQIKSDINASMAGEKLLMDIFPAIDGFFITSCDFSSTELKMVLVSTATHAFCDRCGKKTTHTRGWQKRTVTMCPLGCKRFVLTLYMRRFYCQSDKHIFVEQQTKWLNKYARFSVRCIELMNQLHIHMSSVSTSKVMRKMGITCCPNTCINHLKKIQRLPDRTARNIGIDDFAKRKGHTYGSVIVDHDTGEILELIDSRDSSVVANVLKQYKKVDTITRDRGRCFIKAIKQGAPSAHAITDKFHVIEDLTSAVFPKILQEFLHKRMELLTQGLVGPIKPQISRGRLYTSIYAVLESMCKDARRIKKMAEWNTFMDLYARQGLTLSEIHDKTGFDGFKMGKLRNTKYEDLLNPTQLRAYKAIESITNRILCKKSLDYSVVTKGLHSTEKKEILKRLLFLLREKWKEDWKAYDDAYKAFLAKATIRSEEYDLWNSIVHFNWKTKTDTVRLFLQDLHVTDLAYYITTFQGILSGEVKMNLYKWINMVIGCGNEKMEKFAKGLIKDYSAINNSIASKLNNGILEGSVNKIKTAKRIMGGRASISLLQIKVSSNLDT